MNDVTRKAAQAEGEFPTEVKQAADDNEKHSDEEQHAAEVAKRIHEKSLEDMVREVKEVDVTR